MSIVHIRVDDRLIHGQVAMIWSRHLGATRFMVVDESAIQSDLVKMSLKLATPSNVSLSILTISKAADRILKNAYQGQRVILIVKSPAVLLALLDLGVKIDEVNVGNLNDSHGCHKLSDSIQITQDHFEQLNLLKQKGVKVILQRVPTDEPIEF